ncbi:hypothetical protein [Bacillus sp. 2205SS5-2]|uniref:hypothetical protein n=1 Tax=Bacillus sp. 2205SS5-2 TaxID=3109031 RepID=UPI0030069A67
MNDLKYIRKIIGLIMANTGISHEELSKLTVESTLAIGEAILGEKCLNRLRKELDVSL